MKKGSLIAFVCSILFLSGVGATPNKMPASGSKTAPINSYDSDKKINYDLAGILAVQFKDANTKRALDSVIMNVFLGDSLLFLRVSDENGCLQINGITTGNYYIVFFRKDYEPFFLNNVKVTNGKQLNVDVLLRKQDEGAFQISGKNIYLFITAITTVVLLILIVLAYCIIKLNGKRRKTRKVKEEETDNIKTPHLN